MNESVRAKESVALIVKEELRECIRKWKETGVGKNDLWG